MRSLAIAQHEAARVVVGVALGMRLRRATAAPAEGLLGYAWFASGHAHAWALMYAAGVAWERAIGAPEWLEELDVRDVRTHAPGRGGLAACTRAAAAMLAGLGPQHALVTRALLERDLVGADIARLARGERLLDGELTPQIGH